MRPVAAVALGLLPVALAFSWAEAHPPRPSLVVAEASTHDAGLAPRASFGRHPWEIRNVGRRPIHLRTYFTSGRSGFSLWQGMTHVIEPERSIVVHLTYAVPTDPLQAFAAQATLKTDDPERPEVRLRVVGVSGL